MIKTKLYELRVQKDIRQEEMANLVGVGQSTYSRKERGVTDVTMEEWVLIANFLGVTVEEIYRPNSKTLVTSGKTNKKLASVPSYIQNELIKLKKENSELKEELQKLKAKLSRKKN